MKILLIVSLLFLGCNSSDLKKDKAQEAQKWILMAKQKEKSDPRGALADYSKAIEIDPNNYEAFQSRGALKENPRINDLRGALDDYYLAIETIKRSTKSSFSWSGSSLDFGDSLIISGLYRARALVRLQRGEWNKMDVENDEADAFFPIK